MCRTGGRRCPSSRTPSTGGTRGRTTQAQTGDTPARGNPDPGQTGDTGNPPVYNIAAGNARVGVQGSNIVITGGLTVDGHAGDTPPSVAPGPGREGDTDTPARNIVTGNARVGWQTGGTPGGPGSEEDTPGGTHRNIAAGNARVGVQGSNIVITGGVNVGGPGTGTRDQPRTPAGQQGDTPPASAAPPPASFVFNNGPGTTIGVQADVVHLTGTSDAAPVSPVIARAREAARQARETARRAAPAGDTSASDTTHPCNAKDNDQ